MLHRMALRVLPSLSLAVTEDSVRKQKRIVMFVPGLVAMTRLALTDAIVALEGEREPQPLARSPATMSA